jgi:hypothetical protein
MELLKKIEKLEKRVSLLEKKLIVTNEKKPVSKFKSLKDTHKILELKETVKECFEIDLDSHMTSTEVKNYLDNVIDYYHFDVKTIGRVLTSMFSDNIKQNYGKRGYTIKPVDLK